MRAAIYARYSTELQSDKSIDDQVALCRRFAKQNGHEVVEVYSDAAKSGAFMVNREGIQRLMHDARDKKFDVVIVEVGGPSWPRHGRPCRHVQAPQLPRHQMLAVTGGHMNALLIAVMSGLAQAVREDNVEKVRRGMEGLVREKRSAGGLAYGYRRQPREEGRVHYRPGTGSHRPGDLRALCCRPVPEEDCLRSEQQARPGTPGAKVEVERLDHQRLGRPGQRHPAQPALRRQVRLEQEPDGERPRRTVSVFTPESKRTSGWSRSCPSFGSFPTNCSRPRNAEQDDAKRKRRSVKRKRPQRLLSGLLKCGSLWFRDGGRRCR